MREHRNESARRVPPDHGCRLFPRCLECPLPLCAAELPPTVVRELVAALRATTTSLERVDDR